MTDQTRRLDLHARAQDVARAVAYVRSGGPTGETRARTYLREVEGREALHHALSSVGVLDGLPVRRVAVLPPHDPRPVVMSGTGPGERRPNRQAAA